VLPLPQTSREKLTEENMERSNQFTKALVEETFGLRK